MTIWTIGHGTRAREALARLLGEHAIALLADVRTVPRSRRNPQFNREAMPAALAPFGIAYVHLPGLGGLRRPRRDSRNTWWQHAGFRGYADYMETAEFAAHVDGLLARAAERRTAVMCAETVPWRCHRSLLADALLVRGVEVIHILGPGRAEPHALTPGARVEDGRIGYPGLG